MVLNINNCGGARRIILFCCCAGSLIFASSLSPAARAEKRTRIGVSLPLSGPASTYGQDIKNVLLFAREKAGAEKYEFIIEDDKCSGKEAVNIAHKFISIEHARYVLGLPCSGALLAAAPLYERAETIVISALAASPEVSEAGDYIFRTRPNDADAARLLFAYLSQRHRRIAVLSEQTDYALGVTGALVSAAGGSAIELIQEQFLSEQGDFRAQLSRLRVKKPDGVVVAAQTEESTAQVVKQIRQLRWPVKLYAFVFPASPVFRSLTGQAAEGIVYTTLPSPAEFKDPYAAKLYAEFEAKYGEPNSMDFVFINAWESFQALHLSVQSGDNVKEHLYSASFPGLIGPYSFDRKGDIQGWRHVLRMLVNGKPIPVSSP